jgi:hypothetical protein
LNFWYNRESPDAIPSFTTEPLRALNTSSDELNLTALRDNKHTNKQQKQKQQQQQQQQGTLWSSTNHFMAPSLAKRSASSLPLMPE